MARAKVVADTDRIRTPSGKKAAGEKASVAAAPASYTAGDVKALRSRFGLSRMELGRLLGVTESTVGGWERSRGRLRLQARTLAALNEASGLSAAAARRRLAKSR